MLMALSGSTTPNLAAEYPDYNIECTNKKPFEAVTAKNALLQSLSCIF